MVTVVCLVLATVFVVPAVSRIRKASTRRRDQGSSARFGELAWCAVFMFYGAAFLLAGAVSVLGPMPSVATVLSVAVSATLVLAACFGVASLVAKRQEWAIDNALRAEAGRPRRRHWMPVPGVAALWLCVAVVGLSASGLVLVAVLGPDGVSPTAITSIAGVLVGAMFVAGAVQWWRLQREERILAEADRRFVLHDS